MTISLYFCFYRHGLYYCMINSQSIQFESLLLKILLLQEILWRKFFFPCRAWEWTQGSYMLGQSSTTDPHCSPLRNIFIAKSLYRCLSVSLKPTKWTYWHNSSINSHRWISGMVQESKYIYILPFQYIWTESRPREIDIKIIKILIYSVKMPSRTQYFSEIYESKTWKKV